MAQRRHRSAKDIRRPIMESHQGQSVSALACPGERVRPDPPLVLAQQRPKVVALPHEGRDLLRPRQGDEAFAGQTDRRVRPPTHRC